MIPNNILNMISRFNPNMMELQNINTPDELAQYLLNTGRVNQNHVNQAKQMWNNPQIQNHINSQYK